MPKKNIAFIITSLESGGAERVVSELANTFIKDYNVLIITLYKCSPFYKLNEEISLEYCTENYSSEISVFKKFNLHYLFNKKIYKYLRMYKIDIAASFMFSSNIYSYLPSKLLKIPLIISERSNPNVYTLNKYNKILRKLIYKRTNILVVQTEYICNYFSKIVNESNIEIIQNPLSIELSKKKKPSTAKTNTILNVGRLDSNKSQDLLIKAFANIDNSAWKLVFVGDGAKRKDYEKLTIDLGIQNNVIFAGNIKNIEHYYNSSKIFVFTSKSEGFPNALLEAMYFELPCISTNCSSGPSELITNKKNGVLIPVNDQRQLEKELELLMSKPDLQLEYGKKAHKKVSENNNIDAIYSKWNNIILKLLQ